MRSLVPDSAKCTKCKRVFDLPTVRERPDYEAGICPVCKGALKSIREAANPKMDTATFLLSKADTENEKR